MSRLHEPLQQHIHDTLVSECNDRKDDLAEKLRNNHPAPNEPMHKTI